MTLVSLLQVYFEADQPAYAEENPYEDGGDLPAQGEDPYESNAVKLVCPFHFTCRLGTTRSHLAQGCQTRGPRNLPMRPARRF